jgi:branched-chain amino acid transport system ATP-binding protein
MKLRASLLSKTFGSLAALNAADIDVPERMIVGLVGPNGAGKSTMLSVLSGFVMPDVGRVMLGDKEVTRLSANERARLGMVRTFQVPREFGSLTVRSNLVAAAGSQLGESILGAWFRPEAVRRQELALIEKADSILEFTGLSVVADRLARELSSGQKKLLELGRALMTDPTLLLLDEPFAGVHPRLIDQLIQKLRGLRERGISLLVVEHNMRAVSELCDRVTVMANGQTLMTGTAAQVQQDSRVLEAYLGGQLL